jgi:mycobactin peptide synthetase MbtE
MVARSRDVVLDAFAHQELPIERLVEELNPPRSRSRNPLYQSMIHFRGEDWALVPRDLTGKGDTTVVPLPIDFEVSLLDLDVGVNVTPDGELDVRIVANADLYEPQTAALIAEALNAAFDAFATTPEAAVSTVQLLPAADMDGLLAPPTPHSGAPSQPITEATETFGETLRLLITLLEELLDITGVDAEDNFFALGGDSIIAIKWSAQANAQGLAMTPPMVFEHMTIAELAAAVSPVPAATDQPAAQSDSEPQQYTPMSASGLSADALAELPAAWQRQS